MNPVKTFILSLPDALDRRRSAAQQCAQYGLSFDWVDAFDFRQKSVQEVAKYYQATERAKQKNRLLSPTEIACALGHQKIYRNILANNIPFNLVLEDDFKFIRSPVPLLKQLDIIQQHTNFDVLILGYVKILSKDLTYHYNKLPLKKIYTLDGNTFGVPWQQFSCGTVGYIITQQGAKKLRAHVIRVTADDWLYFKQTNDLNILHIRPFVLLEDCEQFQSSIRIEKENHLMIKPSSYIIRTAKGKIKNLLMNGLRWKR